MRLFIIEMKYHGLFK